MLALCLFLIPIIAWLAAEYFTSNLDDQLQRLDATDAAPVGSSLSARCTASEPQLREGLKAAGSLVRLCDAAGEMRLLRGLAVATAVLGVLLMATIFGARAIAGTDRARMSIVFGPAVQIVMLLLAISALAQAGLFIYGVFTIEILTMQGVHFGVLVAVAVAALTTCYWLIHSSFNILKSEPMVLQAMELDRVNQPALFNLVDDIARRLKVDKPDNIIIGLEPNFFATISNVKVAVGGEILGGRSLFLSLSLMRLFTVDELKAVVGHELAHFVGADLAYSSRFAPVYARLARALDRLDRSAGLASELGRMPAFAALSMCLTEFASAERFVGRYRELIADQAGAEASNPRAQVLALIKVSVFGPQWVELVRHHVAERTNGGHLAHWSKTYLHRCASYVAGIDWPALCGTLGRSVQPHPVDTHPPLAQRLGNLGAMLSEVNLRDLSPPECPAFEVLSNADSIDEVLSELQVQWLFGIGAVPPVHVEQGAADRSQVGGLPPHS